MLLRKHILEQTKVQNYGEIQPTLLYPLYVMRNLCEFIVCDEKIHVFSK